jgi:hypothetical protein
MGEPPRFAFAWNRDEHDPARRAEAIRKAVDFIATFLAEEGDEDKREFERLLRDDPDALYAFGAITAGLVMGDADERGEDPLDVLRRSEMALNSGADGESSS